eukprot:m.70237 g.70237  ORF g.70237 m.70237 type:complete len:153 (-) comp10003_c0_seq2:169-627(-)
MHITPFERDWGGWGDWGDNWGRDHRDEGNAEGQPSPLSIVFAVKILVISIVIFCICSCCRRRKEAEREEQEALLQHTQSASARGGYPDPTWSSRPYAQGVSTENMAYLSNPVVPPPYTVSTSGSASSGTSSGNNVPQPSAPPAYTPSTQTQR